ncbi:hypothetical protein [Streptomyces sp. NPDC056682]|uniref:hypothetical protein n=1 Tax=Streptomyces sp. NPDC056682 TaxID=3345909 RepID=UPI00369C93F3
MPTNPVFTLVDGSGNLIKSVSNGDGTATLTTSAAATTTTFITYLSGAQAVSNTGVSFSTAAVSGLAVDATLVSFTGGSSPGITFFVDRFGSDGVWYRVWTSASLTSATTVSVQIGPFPAATGIVTAVLTGTARFGWSTTGTPTAVTFSASVIGR